MFICYVILHYIDDKTTMECINSILKLERKDDYRIIVVDNASNNGSYERLQTYYHDNSNIEWIKNDKNYGFSAGNNIGYRYAKQKYNPQYILIGNNDLVFEQENFEQKLEELGLNYSFYVAGPDIINLKGIHQSPLRMELYSYKTMKKKNRNKRIILMVMKLKKLIPVLKQFDLLEKLYYARGENMSKRQERITTMKNVVLHGACVIFSKQYISKHDDAFPEYTFLYMEEDILALRCNRLGYDTYYFPELRVVHKEDVSTSMLLEDNLEKNIFVFTESIKAANTYMELLKKSKL